MPLNNYFHILFADILLYNQIPSKANNFKTIMGADNALNIHSETSLSSYRFLHKFIGKQKIYWKSRNDCILMIKIAEKSNIKLHNSRFVFGGLITNSNHWFSSRDDGFSGTNLLHNSSIIQKRSQTFDPLLKTGLLLLLLSVNHHSGRRAITSKRCSFSVMVSTSRSNSSVIRSRSDLKARK